MKRLSTSRGQTTAAIVLVIVALVFYGIAVQRAGDQINELGPNARYNDATPLGGKGLRRLMDHLGYTSRRVTVRLQGVPRDAKIWLVLNGRTHFSRAEANSLMDWVRGGGTLIFAVPPTGFSFGSFGSDGGDTEESGINSLCKQVGAQRNYLGPLPTDPDNGLPQLQILPPSSTTVYWSGVSRATASRNQLNLTEPSDASEATNPSPPLTSTIPSATPTPNPKLKPTSKVLTSPLLGTASQEGDEAARVPTLEIAGTPAGPIVVQRRFGQGRVVLLPDPLLFSNYGLNHNDNAVLATNLLRYGTTPGGVVYFDEREHGEPGNTTTAAPDDFTRYLRVPAVRATLLQLLGASLLIWLLFGTRLGAAVPIPESEPVTRASNFARAMGALFHKAGRSGASSTILANEFRRLVARRVGLTTGDAPDLIASRVAQAADVPQPLVARLLKRSAIAPTEAQGSLLDQAPKIMERLTVGDPEANNEESLVRDAQEMEDILRRLGVRR